MDYGIDTHLYNKKGNHKPKTRAVSPFFPIAILNVGFTSCNQGVRFIGEAILVAPTHSPDFVGQRDNFESRIGVGIKGLRKSNKGGTMDTLVV